MRNSLERGGLFLQRLILFFYPPFQKMAPRQLFLYGVTGSANIVFGWILYAVSYNFILRKENLSLGFVTLSPHVAALAVMFPVTFATGFLFQKYVTFSASVLRGKKQLFRYTLVVIINLLINYAGLKLFVEVLHFYPTPSEMLVTVVTVLTSYLFQKKFTFKL